MDFEVVDDDDSFLSDPVVVAITVVKPQEFWPDKRVTREEFRVSREHLTSVESATDLIPKMLSSGHVPSGFCAIKGAIESILETASSLESDENHLFCYFVLIDQHRQGDYWSVRACYGEVCYEEIYQINKVVERAYDIFEKPCIKNLENYMTTRLSVCSICQEDIPIWTAVARLPCSHLYHKNCLIPWLSDHNTCPLCRFKL